MRCIKLIVIVVFVASFSLGPARAGDEVDYSAPYITVENGELVTKYPAKDHAGSAETLESGVDAAAQPASENSSAWLLWSILVSVAAVISVVVFRRRNH